MGEIRKLYQNNSNVETTTRTESDAVYPITSDSAVYHSLGWGTRGTDQTVDSILQSLNEGYQYAGLATPNTSPNVFDHKVFYIAGQSGLYPYFGGINVTGLTILRNNGNSWIADSVGITGGGGGGSDPSSFTGYIGTTLVQNVPQEQDLFGIGDVHIGNQKRIYFGNTTDVYIEYTSDGFHFSKGIYSDFNITAGGISSGGSGGGGGEGGGDSVSITNIDNTNHLADLTVNGQTVRMCLDGYSSGGGVITETDPIFIASPAYGISASDIINWNNKVSNVQADWAQNNQNAESYIKNKPTLPPTVTEATVAGWGFTKNIGTVTSITLVAGTGIAINDSGTPITLNGSRTISLSNAYQTKISTLEGYFTNGAANNALQLNGHADSYFATASGLNSLSDVVTSIGNRVTAIEDWFEIVDGNLHVKNNRGLYSDSFISAGGLNSSSGGGGGGVSFLKLLEDVYHSTEVLRSNGSNAQNGDFLAYDNTQTYPVRWVAKPLTSAMVTAALGYTPYNATNPNGYASGTITGIIMNNVSKGTSGVVNLGTVITSETDPVFSASAAAGITASDITNWNNKTSNIGTITGIIMNGVSKGTSGVVNLGTVLTEQSLANYITVDAFNTALSYKMNKTDFRFEILCKSNLGSDIDLNTVYDPSLANLTGKFRYYAYVGRPLNTETVGANGHGFPSSNQANALLAIDTYSDNATCSLYQIGLSGNGNIYFRNGDSYKTNSSWSDPFGGNGNWNRLLWENPYGDVSVNGDVVFQKGKGIWLDAAKTLWTSGYIKRGDAANDFALYISPGVDGNGNKAHTYVEASALVVPDGHIAVNAGYQIKLNGMWRRGEPSDPDYNPADPFIGLAGGTAAYKTDLYISNQGYNIYHYANMHVFNGSYVRPYDNDQTSLGTSTDMWSGVWAKRWYPNQNDTDTYIEYVSGNPGYFRVHGNIVADGQVAAGGVYSNS